MPLTVIDGPTIEAGESLSAALDCSAGRIVKITMPTGWTSADLTFQTSTDGVGFNDIYYPDGHDLVCIVHAGGAVIGMDINVGWIKFRSGTRDQPIAQPEIRTFAVALET